MVSNETIKKVKERAKNFYLVHKNDFDRNVISREDLEQEAVVEALKRPNGTEEAILFSVEQTLNAILIESQQHNQLFQ